MRDFSSHLEPHAQTQNNYKPAVFFTIIILAATSGILFYPEITNFFQKRNPIIRSASPKININILPVKKITTEKELLISIDNKLKERGGTFSIYIYDVNKKNGFGINENTVMTAASVNKVPILAALYNLAGRGEVDLDKEVILQKENIQDYGSGSIRYATPGTPYSLKTLARLMMEQSDNTAAYILGSLTIGIDKVQSMVDSWGLNQTDINNNKTSAKNMAILFTKIYSGEITTRALTAEMLGFMDKSDFDDRIPALLPKGIKVYHKTGDEIGKIHDAGIINLPGKPYFLGIFSMDTTDDSETKKTLADISKIVFDYMNTL